VRLLYQMSKVFQITNRRNEEVFLRAWKMFEK
jgi:hypothetical protein